MADLAKYFMGFCVCMAVVGSLAYCGVTFAAKQQQFQQECQSAGGIWQPGSSGGSCQWSRPS